MMLMILIIMAIKCPGIDESSWMAGTLMTVSDKRCQMSNQKWHTRNSKNMITSFPCLRFFNDSKNKILALEAGHCLHITNASFSAFCKSHCVLQLHKTPWRSLMPSFFSFCCSLSLYDSPSLFCSANACLSCKTPPPLRNLFTTP